MRRALVRAAACGALALGGPVLCQAQTKPTAAPVADIAKACQGTHSDDCVIRKFKDSPEASVIRGKIVYQTYCILCHGASGKGDGRAARIHNPPPANLTASTVPKEYLNLIIRKGGEGVGRYKGMPPWDEQLTNEQVGDVINFLMTIRIH